MTHPHIVPLIDALPATLPFIGPETLERRRTRKFSARLGANENGFGPSPRVLEAIRQAAADIWQYGDPENYDLKQALAGFHGVCAGNINIDAGVDALLGQTVRLFVTPGDVVINVLGGYPTFNYHVAAYGGILHTLPYEHDRASLAALAGAAIKHKARVVYLANPDNPHGTWYTATEIAAFLDSLPSDILVILDEAYCEMAPADSILPLSPMRDNVLRMRTFSKAYGLAGIRCGYVIGSSALICVYDKIRDHFSVNRLAQAAALAALHDQNYLAETVVKIAKGRARLHTIAAAHNLASLPSATNFVAIDCGRDGAYAQRVLDNLAEQDIFVRKPVVPVLDRLIRVSVAPDPVLDFFEQAFGPALAAADR